MGSLEIIMSFREQLQPSQSLPFKTGGDYPFANYIKIDIVWLKIGGNSSKLLSRNAS